MVIYHSDETLELKQFYATDDASSTTGFNDVTFKKIN